MFPLEYVIKGSFELIGESASFTVRMVEGLAVISIAVVEIVFSIYRVTLCNHVFKELCNFVEAFYYKLLYKL